MITSENTTMSTGQTTLVLWATTPQAPRPTYSTVADRGSAMTRGFAAPSTRSSFHATGRARGRLRMSHRLPSLIALLRRFRWYVPLPMRGLGWDGLTDGTP